jgi:ankyrin repeat protein
MTELPHELIGEFITAVVMDTAKAEQLLAQQPALLNARWMHNETVLHFLAIEDYEAAVHFLLAHGAAVNTVNEFGDSPLVDMAHLGQTRIAQALLTAGANPNGPSTPHRECPLHYAAEKGNRALVTLLLDAGADPRYVNSYGETVFDALDEAAADDRQHILVLLAARGVVPAGDPDDAADR